MKLLRIVSSVALLLATSFACAQTKEGDMIADVPFPFIVAGHTLPAGHYFVSRFNNTLRVHDLQNNSALAPVHSAQRSARENGSKMVFHRYGDTYFLSEVWVGGDSIGRVLFPSEAERLRKESGAEREIAVVRMER